MSRTYRYDSDTDQKPSRTLRQAAKETTSFRCAQCRQMVLPLPSGGRHRNHCPFCLFSRHVDDVRSGDRASTCGARMAPVGVFARPSGEQVIVHRCLGCGFERYNRVAADDRPERVMALPVVPPRSTAAPSVMVDPDDAEEPAS